MHACATSRLPRANVPERGIEGIPATGARLEGREGQSGLLQSDPSQTPINLFLRALWRVCAWNQAVRQTLFPNTALVAVYLTMIYGC